MNRGMWDVSDGERWGRMGNDGRRKEAWGEEGKERGGVEGWAAMGKKEEGPGKGRKRQGR